MPLVRINLLKGKSAAHRRAIVDSVYRAMNETFEVPDGDIFMILSEDGPEDLVFDRHFMGMSRTEDFVVIQLTVAATRGVTQKKKFYRRMVDLLEQNTGIHPDNVLINLVEVLRENWSFGRGIAQYVA